MLIGLNGEVIVGVGVGVSSGTVFSGSPFVHMERPRPIKDMLQNLVQIQVATLYMLIFLLYFSCYQRQYWHYYIRY